VPLKAVLFDVYETLLTGAPVADPEPGLRALLKEHRLDFPPHPRLIDALRDAIAREHERSPDPHPEIEIRELWRELLPGLGDPDRFALAAERVMRPVRKMPGAHEAIESAHAAGLTLGIVSNAQASTRHLLEEHLGGATRRFDPNLVVLSHAHLSAKPGPRLFEIALARLAIRGIAPADTLMIGDSPANDLEPARALGLRTHHFHDWGHLPWLA